MSEPSSRLGSEEKLFRVYFAVHPFLHDFVQANLQYLKFWAPDISRDEFVNTLEGIVTAGYASLSDTDTGEDTTANQSKGAFSAEPTSCEDSSAIRPGDKCGTIDTIATVNIKLVATEKRGEVHSTGELIGNLTSNSEGASIIPIGDSAQPYQQPPVRVNNPQAVQNDYSISRKRKFSAYKSTYDRAEYDRQNNTYTDDTEKQIWGSDNKVHNSFMSKEHVALISSNQNIATPTSYNPSEGSVFTNYNDGAEHHSSNRKRKNKPKQKTIEYNSYQSTDDISLPFGLQHLILHAVLRAMEDCCYDWSAASAPSILAEHGYSHHKHGELQKFRWYYAITEKYRVYGQGDDRIEPGHNLAALFVNAENIRHAFVHRDRAMSLRLLKNRIRQAVELLEALKDYEQAASVERVLDNLKRFYDYASSGGYVRRLPLAGQGIRKEMISTFANLCGGVIDFMIGDSDLPKEYLMMDALI